MSLEHWLYKLPLRLRSLFRRSRIESELNEEFQYHLDRQIDTLIGQGLSPNQAREAALRAMGGMEQQQEKCREARGVGWIEDLIADSRYALRSFAKNPWLAFVIILSLALGIGANTAIFSVIDAVDLKMLPVRDPGRLVLLDWSAKARPSVFISDLEGNSNTDSGGLMSSNSFASDVYAELKKQNDVFEQTFAFASNDSHVNIEFHGSAESAHLQAVSGNFFSGLGVVPILGRQLLRTDDSPSSSPVAVVSEQFWRKHYGNDAAFSENKLTVNGSPVTIVGVAPSQFMGVLPGDPVDIYIPLSLYSRQWTQLYPDDPLDSPKTWWLDIIGRLKPGVSEAGALPYLQLVLNRALRARRQNVSSATVPTIGISPAARGLNDLRQKFTTSLLLMMGMVCLVLLIACANIAGLLLARATARQKEIAVRLSLGASRGRIVRQLLVESVMLALLGGIAGLVMSFWASSALIRLLSTSRNPIDLPTGVDGRVLAFTAAVSILSGILFGLIPAVIATRVSVAPILKDTAMPLSARVGHLRLGKALVGGQVAFSLLLLIVSGLLLRTLVRLQHVNLGFNQHGLLTFEVRPGLNAYSDQRLIAYYQELQRRLEALPGVRVVTLTQHGPINSGYSSLPVEIPGYTTPGERVNAMRHMVGSRYFETMHIPILLGRAIGDQDTETSPSVLVVNEALVRKYFHGENPIGKRLVYGGKPGNDHSFEIVGVAADAKYGNVRRDVPPTAYWAYRDSTLISRQMVFLVRTEGDPGAMAMSVRQVCLNLDKDVPVVHIQTEQDVIDDSLFLERAFAFLSSAFGALALLLACVGLYGTIGYAVARRTAEIGVRMALGAERGRILRMILSEVCLVVVAGIGIGISLSWAMTKLLRHQLYELSPHDPATITAAAVAILVLALLAGYLPARRASRVDPMVALRCE